MAVIVHRETTDGVPLALERGRRLRSQDRGEDAPARAGALGRPLTIGPVKLATNLMLAPVAKYCDLAFRIVCREQGGVGLACTDLLSPHGLLRGSQTALDLARTNDEDKPIGMQIYGGEPDILAQGAVWAVEHGATVLDINMGCPVDKVTKKDGGSKLLCDPARTVAMTARIVDAAERASAGRVPVTAKLRLGWDDSCLVAPELAVELVKVGVRAITIHGRTTKQRFKGDVDLGGIKDVVDAVHAQESGVPVIGNGDVTTPEKSIAMLERTGCDGVMIGRGSFSRPWIFRQCWEAQQTWWHRSPTCGGEKNESHRAESRATNAPQLRELCHQEPSERDKVAIIRRYFDLMHEYRGEHYALVHIRRRITWFAKALGPCKPLKERMQECRGAGDVHRALDAFEAGGLRIKRMTSAEVAGTP